MPVHQALIRDGEMPGMDGWQTIARVREITPTGQHPITVMVTAHGREQLALRSPEEQTALSAYLIKPITPSMLFDAVADARAGKGNVRATVRTKAKKPQQLAGLRLLVVEDNLVNQQVAQGLLKAAGAHVELAANGELGVQAVAANLATPFDAVLMDIQMPVMDGYAATHAIRHELRLTELPVIAMTANAMASDREACLAAGMNDHVGKPFDLPNLIHVLLLHTGRARQAAENRITRPAPVLDAPAAVARMGGSHELYARAAQSFLEEVPELAVKLEQALAGGERRVALGLLHQIRGAAATVGAMAIATHATQAEAQLEEDATSFDATPWQSQFVRCLEETRDALNLSIGAQPHEHV